MTESGGPEQTGSSQHNAGGFITTHWSVILSAKDPIGDTTAFDAYSQLCRMYWRPLYAFLRRHGHSPQDAEDLVQDFFGSFLPGAPLRNVSPDQGRFRSFLLKCLQNYAANAHRRMDTLRRGGKAGIVSLDTVDAELLLDPRSNGERPADQVFDRVWAETVMQNAGLRLREEYASDGHAPLYEVISAWLAREAEPGDYAAAATKLGLASSTLAVHVHRMRRRFHELVRREVSRTVGTPDEVESEMNYLVALMTS